MKKYAIVKTRDVEKVFCNCCGKEMKVENGIVKEGKFSVQYQWDYFSDKDGQTHCFDLCEECYERITAQFQIPVQKEDMKELI